MTVAELIRCLQELPPEMELSARAMTHKDVMDMEWTQQVQYVVLCDRVAIGGTDAAHLTASA